MKRILHLILAVLVLLPGVRATVVLRLDLPDLVDRAEIIAAGRCLAVTAGRDDRGLVTTTVELLVDTGLRGADTGSLLRFSVPGGEVGDLGLVVPGLPTFAPGDEVFLFLTAASEQGLRVPVGLAQGAFEVVRDADTGQRRLSRSLDGLSLLDPVTGAPVAAGPEAPRDFETFRDAVARLVEKGR